MIAGAKTLRELKPISPFVERSLQNGMSYGLSYAGYDIRVKDSLILKPNCFSLAVSLEKFFMPNFLLATVHDKSSWARRGLAVQTTVIEPGWEGYLTLELSNHDIMSLFIEAGDPIAQIIFHYIDEPGEGYIGKYHNQPDIPVGAIYE